MTMEMITQTFTADEAAVALAAHHYNQNSFLNVEVVEQLDSSLLSDATNDIKMPQEINEHINICVMNLYDETHKFLINRGIDPKGALSNE